jgi:hypothetical protein
MSNFIFIATKNNTNQTMVNINELSKRMNNGDKIDDIIHLHIYNNIEDGVFMYSKLKLFTNLSILKINLNVVWDYIPDEILQLENLEYLHVYYPNGYNDLKNTNIKSLDEISRLTKLKSLNIKNFKIEKH